MRSTVRERAPFATRRARPSQAVSLISGLMQHQTDWKGASRTFILPAEVQIARNVYWRDGRIGLNQESASVIQKCIYGITVSQQKNADDGWSSKRVRCCLSARPARVRPRKNSSLVPCTGHRRRLSLRNDRAWAHSTRSKTRGRVRYRL